MSFRNLLAIGLAIIFAIGIAITSFFAFAIGLALVTLMYGIVRLNKPQANDDTMIDITAQVREV
ncbi:MAG: hypothetical protein OQK24_01975 [Magnetovibrio sp.]|nr:hypothetical protein [Magnetovibrio sp.]